MLPFARRRLVPFAVTLLGAVAVFAAPAASAQPSAHQLSAVSVPGAFVPLTPARLLDTRTGLGAPKHTVAPGGTVGVTVQGHGGVPASGAGAVVLNVTVTTTASSGFITVYPNGATRPTVSNLNFVKGQTVANLVTVALPGSGVVNLYSGSAGSVNLVADVAGYYLSGTASDAGAFVPVSPARILDTRHGLGAPAHVVPPAGTVQLAVGGSGASGVPAGARAVVLNVTATNPTKSGFITVYPAGALRPTASSLNFTAGRTVPNLVTVALGTADEVALYNGSSGTVNLVADVAGYYLPGSASKAGTFVPVNPTRILDTRHSVGAPAISAVGAQHEVGLQTVNAGGVPLANVGAVAMNVTVVSPKRSGYVTVSPTDPTRPTVSNLNHAAGQTIANLAIVPPGLCSKASFFNGSSGTTQLLADTAGYFLAADASSSSPAKTGRSWGYNNQGELADATVANSATPVVMAGVHDIKAIAGGGFGSGNLLVTNDGTVFGWGPGMLTLLGAAGVNVDDGFGNCSIAQRLSALGGITAVAGSPTDGYALDAGGHVWSWGFNDVGQLGDGTTTDNFTPTQISGLDNVTAVAAGYGETALALKSDGTVWAWGRNLSGELGTDVTDTFSPTPGQVVGLSNVTAIAQGRAQFALLSDQTVMAWGSNLFGNLGDNTGSDDDPHPTPVHVSSVDGLGNLSNVTQISDAMALLSDHTVVTWGDNESGQLGNGSAGSDTTRPVAVSLATGLPNVAAIAASGTNDVALGADGTVWAWGVRFASGTTNDTTDQPHQVAGLSGVLAISASGGAGFAVVP